MNNLFEINWALTFKYCSLIWIIDSSFQWVLVPVIIYKLKCNLLPIILLLSPLQLFVLPAFLFIQPGRLLTALNAELHVVYYSTVLKPSYFQT